MSLDINIDSIAKITSIKELLAQINFPYALIKGDALSIQMYGVPGRRNYGDIDLLIDRVNLPQAKKLLRDLGFHQRDSNRFNEILLLNTSHQVSPWYKNSSRFGTTEVDLNVDIFWGEFEGKAVNINELLNDVQQIPIYGVQTKVLPPVKALIQLVLHHYKDMNSIFILSTQKSIHEHKFYEIYKLIMNNLDTITVASLYSECEKYNAIPYMYYMLYYVSVLFKDPKLIPFIEAFMTSEGVQLIDCCGLTSKERRKWKWDFYTRLQMDGVQIPQEYLSSEDKEKIKINKDILGF